jgi:hypothetical protein
VELNEFRKFSKFHKFKLTIASNRNKGQTFTARAKADKKCSENKTQEQFHFVQELTPIELC